VDRIDIHLQVARVEYQKLRDMRKGESSAEVLGMVESARERQRQRFEGTDIASNPDMHPVQVRKHYTLDEPCRTQIAVNSKGVSSGIEVEPYKCRFSGFRVKHPGATGGGTAVPSQAGFGVKIANNKFLLVSSLGILL
jgi:hypothetical protein